MAHRIRVAAAAVCVGLALAFVVWFVVWVLLDSARYEAQRPIKEAIKRDVGFDYGTPYVDRVEVLMIKAVEPGKPAAAAGMQPGDIVIGYHDTRDLIDDLEHARGRSASLTVEREGRRLVLTVRVPRK
jgi:S1-C subfamily serine protease